MHNIWILDFTVTHRVIVKAATVVSKRSPRPGLDETERRPYLKGAEA